MRHEADLEADKTKAEECVSRDRPEGSMKEEAEETDTLLLQKTIHQIADVLA